jgi:hypothetical protein
VVHPCISRSGYGVGRVSIGLDPEFRFMDGVQEGEVPQFRPELGPCLNFAGADNGNGYIQFRYNGRGDYAHRYAWERVNGPIPQGMTVDHLCRVRNCVRLHHLELVAGAENTRRKTLVPACRNGHERTEENTYRWPKQPHRRYCRECRRERERVQGNRLQKSASIPGIQQASL